MRQLYQFYIAMIICLVMGCKKDQLQGPTGGGQNPPNGNKKIVVAHAGPDQTITLPTQTVTLDGSASYDSTGTPLSYSWKLLLSPSAVLSNSSSPIATAVLSIAGKYVFQLSVWNMNGASADTVEVTLKEECSVNATVVAQVLLVSQVPESFDWETPLVYASGKKIIIPKDWEYNFFASGNPISIYDIETNTWITRYLPTGRSGAAVIVAGNKIFFAGGATNPNDLSNFMTDRVEIYDVTTDSWTSNKLSERRKNARAAVVGNKVIFAGGMKNGDIPSKTVDIYDLATGVWSTSTLPGPAREIGAAVVDQNNVYFCGGITGMQFKVLYYPDGNISGSYYVPESASKIIDIYNTTTATWSMDSMSIPRIQFAAVAANEKIFLAGGLDMTFGYPNTISNNNFLSNVEVKQFNPSASQNYCLSRKMSNATSVKQGDNVIFFSGWNDYSGKFDIYNSINNSWSVAMVSNVSIGQASIVAVNNELYAVVVNGGTRLYRIVF